MLPAAGVLGFVAILVALSYALHANRARAVARLREYDQGARCVACESTAVAVAGDAARCRDCGRVVSLAALRAAQPSPDEVAAVTRRHRHPP